MRVYTVLLYFCTNSSTCFGRCLRPLSGAHVKCNYSIWHWSNRICYRPLSWRSRNSVPTPPRRRKVANTVRPMPDAVITVYVCSWWRVKVSAETCRAFHRNRIKLYIVASCWTVIDIGSRARTHGHKIQLYIWLFVLMLQNVTQKLSQSPLDVKQKELEDFFMTDTISRASPTMAKCIQAALKQKQSKY